MYPKGWGGFDPHSLADWALLVIIGGATIGLVVAFAAIFVIALG